MEAQPGLEPGYGMMRHPCVAIPPPGRMRSVTRPRRPGSRKYQEWLARCFVNAVSLFTHSPPTGGNVVVGLDHRGATPVNVEAQRAARANQHIARAGVVRLLAHDLIAVGGAAEWPVHQRLGAGFG